MPGCNQYRSLRTACARAEENVILTGTGDMFRRPTSPFGHVTASLLEAAHSIGVLEPGLC